jgi:hypothetical protein
MGLASYETFGSIGLTQAKARLAGFGGRAQLDHGGGLFPLHSASVPLALT